MKLNEALNIIKQVAGAHVGNLQTHASIQEALKLIEGAMVPDAKETKGSK